MEERCVYVKETVLSELEREKRGLRWQLARTTKLAESRAADVAACKSKVKDLLTIVEMNKSVADRAVKRTYTQASQLQQVAAERDEIQLRLAAHRQRCVERGLRGLEQRTRRRLLRETLHILALRATRSRRLRAAWCRVTHLLSRFRLARAFQQWKRLCALDAVRIHPTVLTAHATASAPVRFRTEFLYDECFRLRFKRRRERKRVAFLVWKAAWALRSRKDQVAAHWSRAQLSRRVLRAWRRRLGTMQRLRATLARVAAHTVRQVVRAWSQVTRRDTERRRVLDRVVRSLRRQQLRRTLARLCLRCVERDAVEWAQALTTAHTALEEEKAVFALHQDAAFSELHTSLAEQEQTTRRFQAAHSRALLRTRRHELLRQRFLTWRAQVTHRRLLTSVATHFHHVQHRSRMCRRHFVAWMRVSAARARVRRYVATATRTQRRALLSRVVRAFATHVQRDRARKRRMHALVSRVRRVWLLRSWSRWQQSFLIGEHRVSAELATHALVERMQQQQLRWQSAFARAEKQRRQLQLQYALCKRDATATRQLRERFRRWKALAHAVSLRRHALKRVIGRRRTQILRLGVARWRRHALASERLEQALEASASTRRHHQLRSGFTTWRRVVFQKTLARWNAQRQRLCFAVWRDARARYRERAVTFCRFLWRRVMVTWQAQALHKWRRWSEAAAYSERNRGSRRRELTERVWRHWSAFLATRLRRRCRQGDRIQSRLREQQWLSTLRGAFQCWKLLHERERRQFGLVSRVATRLAVCRSHHTQQRLLDRWRQLSNAATQRRRLLCRVVRRSTARATRTAWTRWVRVTAQAVATQTLWDQSLKRVGTIVTMVTARHTLSWSFQCWSGAARAGACRRRERDRFATRCRARTLQYVVRVWRRDVVELARAQKAALRRRVDRVRTVALRTAIKRWERATMPHAVCFQSTVSQILVERAQERADELVSALLATRALRTVFSAWTRVVQQCTNQRQSLRRVLAAQRGRLECGAWRHWRSHTSRLLQLERLVRRLQMQRLRVAWATMQAAQTSRQLRVRAVVTLAKLWRRRWLRCQWGVWKRRERLEARGAVERSRQQSLTLVKAVMEMLVHRRYNRSLQQRWFVTWKQQAARRRHARDVCGRLVRLRQELLLRMCFQDWTALACRSSALRSQLMRIASRRHRDAKRTIFHRWKGEATRRLYAAQLETTQQELQRHRVAVAQHVAMAKYASWKHSCLSSHFTHWRIRVRDEKRTVDDKLARCRDRRRTRHSVAVVRAWRQFVDSMQATRLIWLNAVAHSHRALLSATFATWRTDVATTTTKTRVLLRAADAMRRSQLRRGFRQLEVHCRDAQCRESVLSVLTAQNAFHQVRQCYVRKSVAVLLHWKQRTSLAHVVKRWEAVVAAQKQRRAWIGLTRRRFECRSLRRVLRAWCHASKRQRCTRSRLRTLNVSWTHRRLRQCWRSWRDIATRSRQIKRRVYVKLFEQPVQAAVHHVWQIWRRFVQQTNAATAQQVAQSLGDRNEQLVLESLRLKRQLRERRRCQLAQFSSTFAVVVADSNAGAFTRTARAFDKWRRPSQVARVLQCVLDVCRLRRTADAFRAWNATTDALRVVATLTQHRTEALATALTAKATAQKRQGLRVWQVTMHRQRAEEKCSRLMIQVKKANDRLIVQCCLTNWKALAARRRDVRTRADLMTQRADRRKLQDCYSQWRRLRVVVSSRQRSMQLLVRAVGCRHGRLVARSWGRWRAHTADSAVTLAHAKLAVLELEHWNTTCRHRLDQLLTRAMAHWKAQTTTARACRRERVLAFQEAQLKSLQRQCFLAWRNQLPARQRVLHPVLCVRTSLRSHRRGRPYFCAYNEYCRKRQSGWRLSTTRAALRRRVVRTCALSLLLRALRRPYRRVLRRTLWRWFAKVQRISSALAAVSFRTLPWCTPTTSVTGSMLLLALEELDTVQQACRLQQRITGLQLFELLARRFRRHHLRHALYRMRDAVSRCRPQRRKRRGVDTTTTTTTTATATTRAFVARVGALVARRAFHIWKTQYVEDALESAEAAQLELLRALRDVASYRHALDPYAVPY